MINAWQILRLYAVIHLFHKSYFEPSKHFYIKRIGYSTDITRLRTGYIYIHTQTRTYTYMHIHTHYIRWNYSLYTGKLLLFSGAKRAPPSWQGRLLGSSPGSSLHVRERLPPTAQKTFQAAQTRQGTVEIRASGLGVRHAASSFRILARPVDKS